jgi:hypothetical protein
MSNDLAIRVEKLGKRYRIGVKRHNTPCSWFLRCAVDPAGLDELRFQYENRVALGT